MRCATSLKNEDLNHYLFVCKKFDSEIIQLQEKVKEILHKEDANHIGNIDMKVLTGMNEDISTLERL